MLNEAIILAGGFGTRLQSVVNDVPKPMAPVNQEPFLNYIFDYLKFFKIEHVVLSTGYLSEKIMEYFGSEFQEIKISYTKEIEPLGTGGGIRLAMEKCASENVLVLNGDSFFDVDLQVYDKQHRDKQADCSLALRKVEDAARYGTIESGPDNSIASFKEKDGHEKPGLINGGVYILNRKLFLEKTEAGKAFSIEKDFYENRIKELKIYGYEYDGYFIDIGIPEDYQKAQTDFKMFKYKNN
ncbi:MAG: Nucleotidyl transferase [Bacteroidetes bacterium]|nr:Nucleotidyl transferase [Bacteroidota bacterium]MDF2450827.1 Nucleotidyl transferase [Bacteroidota bacterium]